MSIILLILVGITFISILIVLPAPSIALIEYSVGTASYQFLSPLFVIPFVSELILILLILIIAIKNLEKEDNTCYRSRLESLIILFTISLIFIVIIVYLSTNPIYLYYNEGGYFFSWAPNYIILTIVAINYFPIKIVSSIVGIRTAREPSSKEGLSILEGNYCGNCGKNIDSEWKSCPYCSMSLTEDLKHKLYCTNCGNKLEPDWRTCPYCSEAV